ncbi:MAG: tetratricopeptide repeat protein [Planctomycetes bacterium]|nr:tetratricopeptide repeat protein [Planctomycetota bacterium]
MEIQRQAQDAIARAAAGENLDAEFRAMRSSPPVDGLAVLSVVEKARLVGRWELVNVILETAADQLDELRPDALAASYSHLAHVVANTEPQQLDRRVLEMLIQKLGAFARERPMGVAPAEYASARREVARSLIQLGEYEAAEAVMDDVSDRFREVLRGDLVRALAADGRSDQAKRLLEAAHPENRPYGDLAMGEALRGDFDSAVEHAAKSQSPPQFLYAIAGLHTDAGRFDAARATLDLISAPGSHERINGLLSIARQQSDERPEDAQTTLDAAIAATRALPTESYHEFYLHQIAVVLTQNGDFGRAQSIAFELQSPDLMVGIACRHLSAGRSRPFEEALAHAKELSRGLEVKEGTPPEAQIARLQLEVGRADEAETSILDVFRRAEERPPNAELYKFGWYAIVAGFYRHRENLAGYWEISSDQSDPADRAFAFLAGAAAVMGKHNVAKFWARPLDCDRL